MINGIPAPAHHGIFTEDPLDVALPNLDTDRDAAPGALVQKDAAGIDGSDPTKLLRFRGAMATPYVIAGDLHVDLFTAAKDFQTKDLEVEVGVYRCGSQDQCALIGSDVRTVKNAQQWRRVRFHLHATETSVGAGEWMEVRVAVLDGSQSDGWFAFGTRQFDSKITVDTDGVSDDEDSDDDD